VLLIKSRAASPRPWVTHFGLAAVLGLNRDLDGAKAALAESLKLNPEVDSLARFRFYRPWGNPQYWALFEKTAATGLPQTGLPTSDRASCQGTGTPETSIGCDLRLINESS
jgi:hypothetical protein